MELWKKESGLMDFQKEVIDCESDFIILNWCRNASKTFTLAKLIENKKPKNVIYISSSEDMLYEFGDKINNYTKLNEDYFDDIPLGMVVIKDNDGNEIKIYSNTYGKLNKDLTYDYILYDDVLPFNIGVKANKVVSTISYNNYDKWLQKFYPTAKIFEKDYKDMINLNLLPNSSIFWDKEISFKGFLNEYGILDNPLEGKEDEIIMACSCDRMNSFDFGRLILKHDKNGYYGCLDYTFPNRRFRIGSTPSFQENINLLKDRIVYYSGARNKNYDNINSVLIDCSTGGNGTSVADSLINDWIDDSGEKHKGLIDKSNIIYEGYISKFPNAINKLKLVNVGKNLKKLQDELKELIQINAIHISDSDKNYWNYENNIKDNEVILLLAHRLYQLRNEDKNN